MITVGLRAQKGGAVIVVLSRTPGGPELLLSSFLPTSAEGDRLSLEPYRVASELPRAQAEAAVAEGRRRQNELAASGLRAIVEQYKAQKAALLVNRAGWVTDLLDYSREWPEHIPVAENLAVREALRFAVGQCGLDLVELDEKSLGSRLKELSVVGAKPWRREQKLACLAAWLAQA